MKQSRAEYLSKNMERLSKRDRVFMNNPVIMQGLGIAPIVIPDNNLLNALILATAVVLLLTPTRMIAAALSRKAGLKMRGVIFVLTAGIVYIAVAYVLDYLFGLRVLNVGIYLPLLIMEPLILKRYESEKPESLYNSFKKGIITTLGFCVVLFLVGGLRELLATGNIGGVEFLRVSVFPLAALPVGGFIILGLVAAIWRGAVSAFRKNIGAEVSEEE